MLVQITITRLSEPTDNISTGVHDTKMGQNTDVDTIKQPIRVLLVALEDLHILKYLLVYDDFAVVSNQDLAEEVEDDMVGRSKCHGDTLAAQ